MTQQRGPNGRFLSKGEASPGTDTDSRREDAARFPASEVDASAAPAESAPVAAPSSHGRPSVPPAPSGPLGTVLPAAIDDSPVKDPDGRPPKVAGDGASSADAVPRRGPLGLSVPPSGRIVRTLTAVGVGLAVVVAGRAVVRLARRPRRQAPSAMVAPENPQPQDRPEPPANGVDPHIAQRLRDRGIDLDTPLL